MGVPQKSEGAGKGVDHDGLPIRIKLRNGQGVGFHAKCAPHRRCIGAFRVESYTFHGPASGAYLGLTVDEAAGRILGVLENRLVVLDARTGVLLASSTSLGPDSISSGPLIDPRAGRAFVLYQSPRGGMRASISGPGYVGVFDAATGRRLRTVTVGIVGNPHAQALAIDPDSGLVFSLNDNSVSVIDGRRP